MREIRQSGSEGGARFNPLSLPLSIAAKPGLAGTLALPGGQFGARSIVGLTGHARQCHNNKQNKERK